MHFYTYKITNLINGKIYIGVHKTKNLDDGYMGSGKILNKAKKKYGIENFHKEILMFYTSKEDMFEIEALIVDKEFALRNDTYNIKLGGEGGNGGIEGAFKGKKHSKETKNKISASCLGYKHTKEAKLKMSKSRLNKPLSESHKQAMKKPKSESHKNAIRQAIKGRKHSDEAKLKMSETRRAIKPKNTLGKMWIHSLELKRNKMIPNTELIPFGWLKGQKRFKHCLL